MKLIWKESSVGKHSDMISSNNRKSSLWVGSFTFSNHRLVYLSRGGRFLKLYFYNMPKRFDNELAKILSSFMETRSIKNLVDVMNRKNGDHYDLYDVLEIMNEGGFEL